MEARGEPEEYGDQVLAASVSGNPRTPEKKQYEGREADPQKDRPRRPELIEKTFRDSGPELHGEYGEHHESRWRDRAR